MAVQMFLTDKIVQFNQKNYQFLYLASNSRISDNQSYRASDEVTCRSLAYPFIEPKEINGDYTTLDREVHYRCHRSDS